jgi:fructose-1,6-bisphosphatase
MVVVVGLSAWLSTQPLRLRQRRVGLRFKHSLLNQEQAGVIDAELTIVISSISMACKQIASLVQRASISNLTGVQGAVNVQGEDQKKLDVVSNEV